jgi:heat shock protein HslJ
VLGVSRRRAALKRAGGASQAASCLVALVALGLVGCGHGTSGDPARAQLAGVTWQLEAIERDSGEIVTVDDPSRYTARFGEDGRATVRSDCNVCAGTCHLDKNALVIGPLACTRAACPPGSLHSACEAALSTVSGFTVSDGTLVLAFSGGRLRYRAA